jgi:hypothetical protein
MHWGLLMVKFKPKEWASAEDLQIAIGRNICFDCDKANYAFCDECDLADFISKFIDELHAQVPAETGVTNIE